MRCGGSLVSLQTTEVVVPGRIRHLAQAESLCILLNLGAEGGRGAKKGGLTLYLEVEERRDNRPGVEQKTSSGYLRLSWC